MKTIAILSGGDSSEYDISVKSALAVQEALKESYLTYIIIIKGQNWYWEDPSKRIYGIDKNTFTLKLENEIIQFDAAFIAIHGTPGEDGILQGYFEMMKIPYSSCNTYSSAISFNKNACKSVLREYSIPMAKSIIITDSDEAGPEALAKELGLPMFVKPNQSGSSFGVTKVNNIEDIIPAITEASKESKEVMLESLMSGTELACGLLKTSERTIILPLTEIVSKNEFFDYEAKYTPGMAEEISPARISDVLTEKVQSLSSQIYDILGCRGLVRVDFIIVNDRPMFLEINTIPGMTKESIVPGQIIESGLSPGELYSIIIEDILKS